MPLKNCSSHSMSEFDYIIIGAGSAGCVLANKLGQDRSKSILILEAGPMDHSLMIHVPAGVYSAWRDPKFNWNYLTEPEVELDQRSVEMPRGRVIGGSSSINSMVYMRGHPLDFDAWAQDFGLSDWSYEQCLPYFKAGESYAKGGNDYRGADGPLGVSPGSYDNPLYDAFVEAGESAGQGRTEDPNGFDPEGVARLDATRQNGRRCSAAVAHLRPALKRGNVTLWTGAQVSKLLIENGRAIGVACTHKGTEKNIYARETLLSGGAINSPKLLMLSGIGPADHLRTHSIDPILDLPGVGHNLMDHASIILEYECLKHFPIHTVDRPWNKLAAGLRWVFMRDGVAASNIWEAGGLIRGNDSVPYPNLQYHFGPVGFEYTGDRISLSQGFAIHIDQLRPKSRGYIKLASRNPDDAPLMTFNYLSEQSDLDELIEGVAKCRELIAQPAFDAFRGKELAPGLNTKTAEDIASWVRSAVATDFHPCGTCAMGSAEMSVVDDRFRVHGIEGLRVVDASIMPRITSANLNAPTQMIAARAADYITGTPQLPALKLPYAFQK